MKLVQKEVKALTDARKRARIDHILQQFRDLIRITGIKSGDKNAYVGNARNADGGIQTNRQIIADTFAKFYTQLYARKYSSVEAEGAVPDPSEQILQSQWKN